LEGSFEVVAIVPIKSLPKQLTFRLGAVVSVVLVFRAAETTLTVTETEDSFSDLRSF
jgi:hypothetical protein